MSEPTSDAGEVSAREAGLALLLYLAVSLYWLWPLPTLLGSHVAFPDDMGRLMGADVDLMMWVLSWGTHAITTGSAELFAANSFYPSPASLAYSEHLFGQLPTFGPTYASTGNPVLATNVLILSSHVLSAFGLHLLARRFVSAPAAIVGAFFFSFHPWRYQLLGHFYMLGVQWVPLALYATERLLDTGRRRDAFLLFATVALGLLSSFYLAYVLVLTYAVYLPFALGRWRSELDRTRIVQLVAAIGAAAVPFLAMSLPYVLLRHSGFLPSFQDVETADFGASLSLSPYFAALNVLDKLGPSGMGPVAYGLALVAVLPRWRRYAAVRWTAVLLVVTGFLLAHGPHAVVRGIPLPTPYPLLQILLPGFDAVRVPDRLLQIATVGLALLAALGFERIAERAGARAAPALAVAAIAGALLSYGGPEPALHARATGEGVPEAYRWLAENGDGGALLELPRAHPDHAARRMYLSTFHWLPTVGGYSAYPSDFTRYVYRVAARLPREAAVGRVTDLLDLDWILVHRNELKGDPTRWETLPPGLVRVAEFGDDLLLRVERKPDPMRFDAVVRSEETVTGVPRERLRRCEGEIAIADAPPVPWPHGERIRLRLRVRNDSNRAWPAIALNPRHLVRAAACLVAEDRERCTATTVPLSVDLHPGDETQFPVWVMVPVRGQTARLEIDLVQAGEGSLARCGLPPLTEVVPLTAAEPRAPREESSRSPSPDPMRARSGRRRSRPGRSHSPGGGDRRAA